jgi:hypothetical protein
LEDGRDPPRADATFVTSLRSTSRRTRNRRARASALAAGLLAASALPSSAAAAPGSGVSTSAWIWVLAVAAVLVGVLVLLRLRAGRQGAHASLADIADGRELLIARGRRVTEQLTALTDVVAEREDEGATRDLQSALDIVTEVRGRIGRTSGQRVQTKAHQDLDEAEWLIGVLRARLDGFVSPAQPSTAMPATCFFDGAHGLATVEIDLEGISLQRVPVRSCAACAVSLVRGERPPIGSVEIAGHTIPWPSAPRWCGSYGWVAKDLKHLSYDGDPLFAEHQREEAGKRKQTVAERARGVRARVVPEAPQVLPEDEVEETFVDEGLEQPVESAPEALAAERREDPPAARSAFALEEDEVAEAAPVAASDTPE